MSARRSVAISLGASVASFVIQFGGSLILARLLSPTEMGIYAVAMAVYWVVNALNNLGLAPYLIREPDMPPEKIGTVLSIGVLQALLLACMLWLLAPLVAAWAHEPRVTAAVRMLSLYAIATMFYSTMLGLFSRRMQFGRLHAINTAQNLLAAIVTVVLAYRGFSYFSMLWGIVVGAVFASAATFLALRRDVMVRPTLVLWRHVMRFGGSMLVTALILNFCNKLPDIILSRMAGVRATGLYNRAGGLVDVFNNSVLVSFQRVMETLFVQYRDQAGGFRYAYVRATRITTGLIWPAFAGLGVLAAPTISLLYGAKWVAAAPVLSLLCLAAIVNAALANRTEALATAGQVSLMPRIEGVRGVAGVAMFAGGAHFGMVPAAATRILDALLAALLYTPHVHRAAGIQARDVPGLYLGSAGLTVAAAAPAAFVMQAFGWPDELPLAWIGAAVGGGVALWLAAIALTRHELGAEIGRVLGRFAPRSQRA